MALRLVVFIAIVAMVAFGSQETHGARMFMSPEVLRLQQRSRTYNPLLKSGNQADLTDALFHFFSFKMSPVCMLVNLCLKAEMIMEQKGIVPQGIEKEQFAQMCNADLYHFAESCY